MKKIACVTSEALKRRNKTNLPLGEDGHTDRGIMMWCSESHQEAVRLTQFLTPKTKLGNRNRGTHRNTWRRDSETEVKLKRLGKPTSWNEVEKVAQSLELLLMAYAPQWVKGLDTLHCSKIPRIHYALTYQRYINLSPQEHQSNHCPFSRVVYCNTVVGLVLLRWKINVSLVC